MHINAERIFVQSDLGSSAVENLPDGSVVICDERSKAIHSLNASAASVWRACAEGASESHLFAALADGEQHGSDEALRTAIHQLQQAHLIEPGCNVASEATVNQGRRAMVRALGTAVPLVLTLGAAQQRAYAGGAKSHPPDDGGDFWQDIIDRLPIRPKP